MSSSPLIADRPPGGTRRSGVKTPRKVQWMDHGDEGDNTKALDESGVNLEPFETLKDRLERHSKNPSEFPFPQQSTTTTTTDSSANDSPGTAAVRSNPKARIVSGETYIPAHETAGLPGTDLEEYSQQQASQVVQAHRHGFLSRFRFSGMMRRSRSPSPDSPRSRSRSRSRSRTRGDRYSRRRSAMQDAEPDTEGETDVECTAEASAAAPRPRPGTSILSTLLTMYNDSTMSFRAPSRSFDESRPNSRANSRPSSLYRIPTSTTIAEEESEPSSPMPSEATHHTTTTDTHKHKWKKPSLSLHMPFKSPTARPDSARNAGGVFGALVASTSNLSGAATPSGSSIAPAVNKPGYRLSRYSVDEGAGAVATSSREGGSFPFSASPAATPYTSEETPLRRPPSAYFDSQPHHHSHLSHSFNASSGDISGRASPSAEATLAEATPIELSPPSAISLKPTLSLPSLSAHSTLAPSPSAPSLSLSRATTPTPKASSPPSTISKGRQKWTYVLKDLPKRGWSRPQTPVSTPGSVLTDMETLGDRGEYFDEKNWEHREREKQREREREKERENKERRRKRKKAEIYITRHVAEIIQRQEFICKLARAMMMFGGPSHRLQAQIQATARVLEVELSCMYLPDMMLISFDDPATGTSNIKLIRQGGAFDISKLQAAYKLYWKVIHDDISVKDASVELDNLMRKPPRYNSWQLIFFGGMCSASICTVSFNGSFIDALISFPLGCLLIVIQLFAARHELYSNVFEITVATLFSFIAAALASTGHFCYSAVAASSVVLILPGYIILAGSLELSSHNIVSGAVRVCFSVIYSLFLGFGFAIGSSAWTKATHHQLNGQDDVTCSLSHDPNGPWYQRTPSIKWAFLTVPMYSTWLSLRFYADWRRRELPLLVGISCIGWVTNHFTGLKFPNQNDIPSAVGALSVGLVSNLYARFCKGNAFVIMITGILFQLPSGLANGGLFTFVSKQDQGQSSADTWLSGFQTALQLVSVSIGLTVGLGISLVLVFPIQSRRRAAGVFSL